MPIYEYKCNQCNDVTKKIVSFKKRENPLPCKKCGKGVVTYIKRDHEKYNTKIK